RAGDLLGNDSGSMGPHHGCRPAWRVPGRKVRSSAHGGGGRGAHHQLRVPTGDQGWSQSGSLCRGQGWRDRLDQGTRPGACPQGGPGQRHRARTIYTPLIDGLSEEWKVAKSAELPLGRFGRVEEVAPTALLLASSPDGDIYVGQTLGPNSGDVMP